MSAPRVTDDEARVFAAYHTDDSPAWYTADPSLLKQRGDDREQFPYDKERDEFIWLRDLAADLLDERAKVENLFVACRASVAALTQRATYPADIAAARLWLRAAIAAASPTAEGISAEHMDVTVAQGSAEAECDCNGEGRCGYCVEQQIARAESLGEHQKEREL